MSGSYTYLKFYICKNFCETETDIVWGYQNCIDIWLEFSLTKKNVTVPFQYLQIC